MQRCAAASAMTSGCSYNKHLLNRLKVTHELIFIA